jgi:hypothetical protein
VDFNSPDRRIEAFAFANPARLVRMDVTKTGASLADLTLRCDSQPEVTASRLRLGADAEHCYADLWRPGARHGDHCWTRSDDDHDELDRHLRLGLGRQQQRLEYEFRQSGR